MLLFILSLFMLSLYLYLYKFPGHSAYKKRIKIPKWVFFLIIFVSYSLVYLDFFPNREGRLGHDYSSILPMLLSHYFWTLRNGILNISWFNPYQCGGVPVFPNPQDMSLSLPQWLSFFIEPLGAVTASFLVLALLGFLSFYFMARKIFKHNFWTALLGAVLFLFNSFYSYRMVIGHVNYHSFALWPLLALIIFWKIERKDDKNKAQFFLREFFLVLLLAYLFAYFLYSGAIHVIPALGISIIALCCLHYAFHSEKYIWYRLLSALAIAFLLSGAKLYAEFSLIQNVSREYGILGSHNILRWFHVFFWSSDFSALQEYLAKIGITKNFAKNQHEWEFSLSPIPLFSIIIFLIYCTQKYIRKGNKLPKLFPFMDRKALFFSIMAFLVFLIPLMVTFELPLFSELLRKTPGIKNIFLIHRWFAAYIPLLILLCMFCLEKVYKKQRAGQILCIASILFVILFHAAKDKSYYHNESYDPTPISAAYERVKQEKQIPPIKELGNFNTFNIMTERNIHISGKNCYNALFGYEHEFFPKKHLMQEGSIFLRKDSYFNMKDPSCYVFPKENSCEPGDHFKLGQKRELEKFSNYRAYDFRMPRGQKITNAISIFVFLLGIVYILAFLLYFICQRISGIKRTA